MRLGKLLAAALVVAVLCSACGGTSQARIERRCDEIFELYAPLYQDAEKTEPENKWEAPALSQSGIDDMENLLMDAGLDVLDTDGEYPACLRTGERFYEFWDAVGRQENARQEIITIKASGELSYRLFSFEDGTPYVYDMNFSRDGERYYEKMEILDWTLTERGNFYYRIYPADDGHYADYTLIRLEEPDRELWDMNTRYILAGGYLGTNMFLTDWTEKNFGELSFNDLWEYLYYDTYGEPFWPEGYPFLQENHCYAIPAEEFEEVILPYFNMEREALRRAAGYDEQGDFYPWHQLDTDDHIFLSYYTIQPEVTACRPNPDGTLTLTVQVLSTDLKTDCLFAHEVTVRPLENGRFQYVGNRVTYQTAYGLPFCEPRLTWAG